MRREELVKEIVIPEGVTVDYTSRVLTAKGAKGEVSKKLFAPAIAIEVGSTIVISSKNVGKREKMMLGTFASHAANLVKGAAEGFEYKLKICAGHFPMNVSMKGNKFEVKNYIGEKVPRLLTLKEGAVVKIEGEIITVTAVDKELASQVAADIEQLTRLTNKDRRIFQDGIYITEKAGKVL
jgi:large subunit ribosomal protein L6